MHGNSKRHTVKIDGNKLSAKGPHGEVTKTIAKGITVKIDGDKIEVHTLSKALKGTNEAIVMNMFKGVTEGYTRNFKLLYAHFPITIESKGTEIMIKNFLGEKQARKTKSIGTTKVQAKGQAVTVSGPDKEAVGQTIANLVTAMRIKDKDGRIFQDGIYEIKGDS
ncbi:MAG: 50S ribosomal protein L6 [Candidatus Micrarchaeota archaeon]